MTAPRDRSPTYGDGKPLAIPALVLWIAAVTGALSRPDAATSPKVIGSADPENERGLPPGSGIFGTDGSLWLVNTSGIPMPAATLEDVTALVGNLDDLPTDLKTSIVAAIEEIDGHANRAIQRVDQSIVSHSQLTAVVADETMLRTQLTNLIARIENVARDHAGLGPATVNGKIKTQNVISFAIDGRLYLKTGTDNLWDLSGQSATDGTHYRALWLLLNNSGTASIGVGTDQTSEAAAIAALPAVSASVSVIGFYVAAPSTTFTNALSGGTYGHGYPAAFNALPALTASATVGIANGGTNGRIKLSSDVNYTLKGKRYTKAATDDLWDLHLETTVTAAKYRAYALLLDSAGASSFTKSLFEQDTAAAAITDLLQVLDSGLGLTKAMIGFYIAGPSTNFANALGAQGTYGDGWPAEAY